MTNLELQKKLIGLLMKEGKKSKATNLVKSAIEIASKESGVEKDKLLPSFIRIVRPSVNAVAKKIGNNSYIVPYALTKEESEKLALKFFVKSARERKKSKTVLSLSRELVEGLKGRGNTIKKKKEVHKLAEANKSFAFYR